jgi:hypothetical protein
MPLITAAFALMTALLMNISQNGYANLDLMNQRTNALILGGFFLVAGILLILLFKKVNEKRVLHECKDLDGVLAHIAAR